MSAIRCIYSEEPNFPATDQHPDAERYQVGSVWVDALDGEPTQEEIDAVLNPPVQPMKSQTEKLTELLTSKGVITAQDAAALTLNSGK